jgi:two-component system chemotaxis sensor kinase CheA
VVIVENSERKMGFLTDELIGQQQIVIKSLGATMRGLPGIAGGAVMSDGRVGLVIDISSLMTLKRPGDSRLLYTDPKLSEQSVPLAA